LRDEQSLLETIDGYRYPPATYGDDIVPSDMRLRDGWHEVETTDHDRFRWLQSGAYAFFVNCGASQTLVIDMEPGPSAADRPSKIEVIVDGRFTRVFSLEGRATVQFVVPARPVGMSHLAFRVHGESRAIPGEARLLDLRVFRIAIARRPHDVVPLAEGCSIGRGWYPLEAMGREVYRWVRSEASILVSEPRPVLVLDIEPSPWVAKPLGLEVDIGQHVAVHRFALTRRQTLRLELPKDARFPATITLRSKDIAPPAILVGTRGTFRVFRYFDPMQQHLKPAAEPLENLAPPLFNPYFG
jgi:hypothetical protein